jgi:Flp pilus assembly protein TadB
MTGGKPKDEIQDIFDEISKKMEHDSRSDEGFVAVEESREFIRGVGRILGGITVLFVVILILVATIFDSLALLVLTATIVVLLAIAITASLILARWDARLKHIELLNQRFAKEIEWIQERLPQE